MGAVDCYSYRLATELCFLLICYSITIPYTYGQISKWRNDLDQYISAVMNCRNIPGLSISIVQNGETILSTGYGYSKTDGPTLADENTLYPIGSLTKSFTSAIVADILSKQKNFTWDTPIVEILGSSFQLADCYRTKEVNLRDLLSHRVGLEEETILTVMGLDIKDTEFLRRLGFLQEKYPFRSRFYYSNYMYSLAGKVAEALTDQTYGELVKERLFDPLGMTSSNLISNVDSLSSVPTMSHGYAVSENGQSLPYSLDTLRIASGVLKPSGDVLSTADDLAKWMIFQLTGGRSTTGTQVVSREFLSETHKSQNSLHDSKIMDKALYPVDDTMMNYGMGWIDGQYRGFERLTHGGNIASYNSLISMFPSENIGIATAINGPMDELQAVTSLQTINWFVADKLLNETPWLDKNSACTFPSPWVAPRAPSTGNQPAPPTPPTTLSEDSVDLDLYVGMYGHLVYGYLHISKAEDAQTGKFHLRYSYGMFGSGRLYPTQEHTFKITIDGDLWYYADNLHFNKKLPGGIFIEFKEPVLGEMTKVTFPIYSAKKVPEFKRDLSVSDTLTSGRGQKCDNDPSVASKVKVHHTFTVLIIIMCAFQYTDDFHDFV
ncbi:uncharacterized protein LOC144434415 [Glandiceps talaboti]